MLYGISSKFQSGEWEHKVFSFSDEETANRWLKTEEYDFREREVMNITAIIRLAGKNPAILDAFETARQMVLDCRTDNYSGDFVRCTNCGKLMLVDIGADCCPECKEETLMWVDEDHPEVDSEYFENSSKYALL